MNTLEIARALSGVRAATVGVYAADRIPRALTLPAAIVTNMDPASKPGSHWVAFYIGSDGRGIYFDSYGLPPTSPFHLDRLKRNCANFRWNKKKLQSYDSKVCGEYCIMFLRYMCSGSSLSRFCKVFSNDSKHNDLLVAKFYKTVVKQLKSKKRTFAANLFPNENSTGRGGCQTCACLNKMLL